MLRRIGAIVAAGLMAAPLAGMGSAVADDYPRGTTLRPAHLDRGPDTSLFHVERQMIVDGDRRIRVEQGRWVYPLGRVGGAYLVQTVGSSFDHWQLLRVDRSGDTTRIAGGRSVPLTIASDDGSHVALVRTGPRRTRFTVLDSTTGTVLRHRRFRGHLSAKDYGNRRLVLTERGRTFWWNPHNNRQVRISRRPATVVDISANRVSLHFTRRRTDDCLRVARLSAPSTTLWRTCTNEVIRFSPNGDRMVTSPESDDHRPPVRQVRRDHGRVQATYRARSIGFVEWENNRSVLIEALGTAYTAVVRCSPPRGCERVTRLHKHPGPRPRQLDWHFPEDWD